MTRRRTRTITIRTMMKRAATCPRTTASWPGPVSCPRCFRRQTQPSMAPSLPPPPPGTRLSASTLRLTLRRWLQRPLRAALLLLAALAPRAISMMPRCSTRWTRISRPTRDSACDTRCCPRGQRQEPARTIRRMHLYRRTLERPRRNQPQLLQRRLPRWVPLPRWPPGPFQSLLSLSRSLSSPPLLPRPRPLRASRGCLPRLQPLRRRCPRSSGHP